MGRPRSGLHRRRRLHVALNRGGLAGACRAAASGRARDRSEERKVMPSVEVRAGTESDTLLLFFIDFILSYAIFAVSRSLTGHAGPLQSTWITTGAKGGGTGRRAIHQQIHRPSQPKVWKNHPQEAHQVPSTDRAATSWLAGFYFATSYI